MRAVHYCLTGRGQGVGWIATIVLHAMRKRKDRPVAVLWRGGKRPQVAAVGVR